jgi:predicted helicase
MLKDFNELQGVLFARMVDKVGDKPYWEQWAKSVAELAQRHIDRITRLVSTPGKHQKEFAKFLKGLQKNINPSIDEAQAIEMLAQHIITQPVFEALFEGYSFAKNNPMSQSMQKMLDLLEENAAFGKDEQDLQKFYDSVKMRASGIDNAEGKQKIIIELYDKFFKTAFPRLVERLGIVYTPVEVVDFIIHSVEAIAQKEFGRGLSSPGVNILDPFTGTGTFITRLLQSGIIRPEDMERKYTSEIFANEIVLLAYYIASINIENAYHDITAGAAAKPATGAKAGTSPIVGTGLKPAQVFPRRRTQTSADNLMAAEPAAPYGAEERAGAAPKGAYVAFPGICLADTFQLTEGDNADGKGLFSEMFPQNSERAEREIAAPITVIMGNPPYSVGQTSANDNAQNQSYPHLEQRIAETYAKCTKATNKNALYDSYIKAFRWASDRICGVNSSPPPPPHTHTTHEQEAASLSSSPTWGGLMETPWTACENVSKESSTKSMSSTSEETSAQAANAHGGKAEKSSEAAPGRPSLLPSWSKKDKGRAGIVVFVSNAGWLDGNAMDGMRKRLEAEFDKIYVFNLRGNCRTSGELRRREAGNVFGLGSRTPIVVTILVKKGEQK